MAKVKIKIEVNPNADDEELGNIQNQVNNTPSLENVSNVSVKIRGDGIYEEIPSNSGGINGLSLGYALVFDENGYLDNADLEGGVLESTENPVEFVWGVVPENGEYTVRLTFTDAQSLKDITIFGDSEVNQFPARAIIDGYKEITNDDLTWYINFGNEASTHTIEFTHWNRVNYNACLSKIGITLQYIEIDKTSGLKSVDSTSQSSTDTTGIFYGTVENRGSLEILDKTGELVDMLKDGIIDNSNTKLEIVANNETIQTHISTDSTYNANSKIMALDLGNRLSSLDILKYKGYDYPDHSERLSVLFFDVLSNLRYALFGKDKELTEEEFKGMLSAKYDVKQTLYEYLYSIIVDYPVIEANKTYREVIDEFCLIAQMQMYIDDEDNVNFVSARPVYFEENLPAINIPKKNMFSQLDYAVVLKNKYDGVEISITTTKDEEQIKTDAVVYNKTQNIDYTISNMKSYFYIKEGDLAGYRMEKIEYSYDDGIFRVDKTSKNGLYRILEVPTQGGKCYFTIDKFISAYTGKLKNPNQFVLDLQPYNNSNTFATTDYSKNVDFSFYASGDGDLFLGYDNTKINDESYIKVKEYENYYEFEYHILSSTIVYAQNELFAGGLDLSNVDIAKYSLETFKLNIKGIVREISFEELQSNTPNIELAKTKVSLNSSNLIQSDYIVDTIKNNILNDYKNGVSNATVSISCNDYFDENGEKAIDWAKGEIPEVNQILYFDNDLYADGNQRYWKIKGRTFRKTGVPMVDLELEESKLSIYNEWEYGLFNENNAQVYTWNQLLDNNLIQVVDKNLVKCDVSLTGTLKIPPVINNFYDEVFLDCSQLKNIIIPFGIERLTRKMFSGCHSLTNFSIPFSVKVLDNHVFQSCISLKSVYIPATVDYIPSYFGGAFLSCVKLTIYCESPSQNPNWGEDWNAYRTNAYLCPVKYGYTFEQYKSEVGIK